MPDLFGISVSGLKTFQSQLTTTAHNITNVNTEGYSRQNVELATRQPEFTGVGYIGSGVRAVSVQRSYDSFIDNQLAINTGVYSQLEELYSLSSQLDNLVADPAAGLIPGIQNFFDSIQAVSDAPASLPARQSLIAESQGLVDRFEYFSRRFSDLLSDASTTIENSVSEINSIASNIADLNLQISTAGGDSTSQPINDLLDQRQQLIVQLSSHVAVNTLEQDDGSLNVFIGTGQALVVGGTPQTLSTANNPYDVNQKDIYATNGTTTVNITNQLTGGTLGAASSFIRDTLNPALNALGRVALGLADTVNNQHQLGVDLDGALGGNFFNAVNDPNFGATVSDHQLNAGTGVIGAQITDTSSLTTSDYILRFTGGTQYSLTRTSDNTVTQIDSSVTPNPVIDGVTLSFGGSPTAGDTFKIRPTANAARGIRLEVSNARAIAAAAPVRGENSLNNTGTGLIGNTIVTDATAYAAGSPPYRVISADNSGAIADGGATRGTITDNNTDSTLQYELRINGTLVYTQNEAAAALADVNALAAQINGSTGTTGVTAYVNGSNLYLANNPPSATSIVVNETLNTTAGTVEDGDTVTGYFGSALTGSTTPTSTVTFTGAADSYVVLDSSNTAVADGAYTAGSNISFNGVQTSITGTPNTGDVFTVSANTSGVSDNRNLLVIGALQDKLTLAGGTATYYEAYGEMVGEIGTQTRKIEITKDAQEILLNQSIEARASKSGVNLDEEAANLVKFQQAYQAVAQMISIADELFKTLISVVGR